MVSLVVALVLVLLGLALLTWDGFVHWVGRTAGQLVHLVRRRVSVVSVADTVVAQRDVVAAAFAGRWGRSLGYAAANRMLDYAALVASLYAVGAHARPSMVLLAYVISLGLALVPITPGGLGFVEAGLTTILVLAGVSSDQAVLATLLYRLVSYWLPIPVGALAYAGWHLHLRPASAGKIDQFDPCPEPGRRHHEDVARGPVEVQIGHPPGPVRPFRRVRMSSSAVRRISRLSPLSPSERRRQKPPQCVSSAPPATAVPPERGFVASSTTFAILTALSEPRKGRLPARPERGPRRPDRVLATASTEKSTGPHRLASA